MASHWRFSQLFGEKTVTEEVAEVDIVSAIEFDETGEFIAVGDRGGRVVVFERSTGKERSEYKFFAEFQSHDPEFDYLKSLEIEEKINKIRWCSKSSASHTLLTTNDKTIKLWKLFEKKVKTMGSKYVGGLSVPVVEHRESTIAATPRKVFSNAHAYHINSISLNSDGETFISADDLRINLWNLEVSDQSFNIVDIKPPNMDELSEVITAAEFHPIQCNTFVYSSSKGTIKLGDMRGSALCDSHAKCFEQEEDSSSRSFFSEIISSISDCKFSRDGRYIISRDYLTIKIWDMNMERQPVKVINIHDHLRSKLCDLYENDCIFDKFECQISTDGNSVMTGSYNNMFYIYDWVSDQVTSIEANKLHPTGKIKTTSPSSRREFSSEPLEYTKKCLHASVHPKEEFVAIGASNNLFLYENQKTMSD
eukprot:TRINITY_DN2399_c0_g1_i1.p1 TRINITY_DN2399_c0_g1~~TRINITY_DN2399_c0_g1_i1.p1  ORF type:complete len:422 (-),score=199.60 TRINITY_DN2399_c0_g1_i1:404-1669(-)